MSDFKTGKEMESKKSKYLDFKGKMHRTPYGVSVTLFLNEKLVKAVLDQEPKKFEKEGA